MDFDFYRTSFCECELNGERVPYDACQDVADVHSLAESARLHENLDYIGTGNRVWVNGVEQSGKYTYYFFKYKNQS